MTRDEFNKGIDELVNDLLQDAGIYWMEYDGVSDLTTQQLYEALKAAEEAEMA